VHRKEVLCMKSSEIMTFSSWVPSVHCPSRGRNSCKMQDKTPSSAFLPFFDPAGSRSMRLRLRIGLNSSPEVNMKVSFDVFLAQEQENRSSVPNFVKLLYSLRFFILYGYMKESGAVEREWFRLKRPYYTSFDICSMNHTIHVVPSMLTTHCEGALTWYDRDKKCRLYI